MRSYQLYIITDEFASHYFGRESMFFQLFKEYESAYGELYSIITKQIIYITKPIPSIRLHQYIQQQLQNTAGYSFENGIYQISYGKSSFAKLEIFDRYLTIDAKGSYEAETCFFEVLRKNEGAFLAIDLLNDRYGWLKPIKERKFV
ncbi:sporulation inhibitor of replication protein SirA [Robertmurraya siralis]|uniref:Sporulation inhibitor of replication protein SirA n=1 Tax=Robertmurraya siralis TaxID=77777 RepID=A0A919WH54_9BACI|nr:sporulation inhibitor of replication protein SirA [Robertmurraya siralis]PAE21502.1 hypothetical protein CHH80_06270 [Bacillus sp. 7504-2]GIN61664.1 sporulation inhibitor of replication protein SirA [Robertmurraya siralis]